MAAVLVALPAQALAEGDVIPPTSSASPPPYATAATFDVPYTATDDGGSGVARVELYARAPGDLVPTLVATDDTPDTPVFSYTAMAGDGAYSFYTVAYDGDGNIEPPPLLGDDGTTVLDTAAPASSATATPPTGSGPITVDYATSDGGSGVSAVELWVQPPGADSYSLAGTDTSPDSASFDYQPAAPGDYSFYTRALDAAGNYEDAPASADTTVTVPPPPPPPDTTPPQSAATATPPTDGGPITVDYTASDSESGVASVELWVLPPGADTYTRAATDTTPDSSSFTYQPAGPGDYSFYTRAQDLAGNYEDAPATADTTVTVPPPPPPPDTTPPESAATAKAPTGSGPITVNYTASDSESGVSAVELWVLPPGGGSYSLAATDATPDSPSFTYQPAGPGDYSFYTRAVDLAGNREAAPATADTTVNVPKPPPPPDTTPQSQPPANSDSQQPPASQPIAQLQATPPAAPAATPAATQQQSAFVAAIFLPKQTLGAALRDGLALKLYAYRSVTLRVALAITPAAAHKFGLRHANLASKVFKLQNPGVYMIRVRVPTRAAKRLRRAPKLSIALKSVLTSSGSSSATTSLITLKKR